MVYDHDRAVELSNLVQSAYNGFKPSDPPVLPPYPPPGYDILATLNARPLKHGLLLDVIPTELFGFVAAKTGSKEIFVVCRGTETFFDWLADFDFKQTPCPWGWGQVEIGFLTIYADFRAALLAHVPAGAEVFVTGHSLGGALAVVAAGELKAGGRQPVVYTFAGPRTGDIEFAAQYRKAGIETYRVVNTEDLVPTVPLATTQLDGAGSGRSALESALGILRGSGLNYQHVGGSVDFTVNNGTISDNHALSTYKTHLP